HPPTPNPTARAKTGTSDVLAVVALIVLSRSIVSPLGQVVTKHKRSYFGRASYPTITMSQYWTTFTSLAMPVSALARVSQI
ncbi:MAG: hypothetical protein FWF21_13850, partial [Micrococcales bacterium]|nr:hypothetical protein [Micrococcales bacterium]